MSRDLLVNGKTIREVAGILGEDDRLFRAAFNGAQLPPQVLEDDSRRISYAKEIAFFELLAEYSGNGVIGIELGLKGGSQRSTLAEYVMLYSDTLSQALINLSRYLGLNRPVAFARTEWRSDYFIYYSQHSVPLTPVGQQLSEYLAGRLMILMNGITQKRIRPLSVGMLHSRTEQTERVAELLGAPVAFDAPFWEFRISLEDAALPVVNADRELLKLIVEYGDSLLAQVPRERPFLHRVQSVIVQELQRDVSVKTVAENMGMTPRTLSRRLAAEGNTYRQVLHTVREELAQRYLSDPEIPLADVAFLLGYSDQSSFINAYRRWTGQTPGYARQSAVQP